MNLTRICRPRTAGFGLVTLSLLVGTFDQPPKPVRIPFDAPYIASTSDRKAVRDTSACKAIAPIPRDATVKAVFNVSAWAPGGWPYWKAVCLYDLPKRTQKKADS